MLSLYLNNLIQLNYIRQLSLPLLWISAKAFDNVNHNLLWIISAVPKSNPISLPQGSIVSQCPDVRVQSLMSERCATRMCNLSSLLFSLFISDLESEVLGNHAGAQLNKYISVCG